MHAEHEVPVGPGQEAGKVLSAACAALDVAVGVDEDDIAWVDGDRIEELGLDVVPEFAIGL